MVTAHSATRADILCDGGKIRAVLESEDRRPTDNDLDVRGCLVFPGFIDPHIHSRDPGFPEKEDLEHATAAAAAGGVTTVFDMPNTIPPPSNSRILSERIEQHSGRAYTDFGLWGLAIPGSNLSDISGLIRGGVIGIKLFWPYGITRGDNRLVPDLDEWPADQLIPPPSHADVLQLFSVVGRLGGLLAAHCEDRGILDVARHAGAGRDGLYSDYQAFLESRPDVAEASAVATGIELSRATGCRFHVVHLSSRRGIELVRQAQGAGIEITAETCPHYLLLSDKDFGRLGARMKVFPPIRKPTDQEALWDAARNGVIPSIGSDHAPHTVIEKTTEDLIKQPPGVLGVETLGPLMINEALRGQLSIHRLAWLLSEGTARLYRIYPRKGALLPGSDADLTIVDPESSHQVMNDGLHSKTKLSLWDGVTLRGKVRWTILGGQTIAKDGEPSGPPRGQFISPARNNQPEAGRLYWLLPHDRTDRAGFLGGSDS